ncbi:MAG: type III pantothenate kinase, partial [Clostridiales Family XIII bacterium]|nr:type III pantothenate kinase [Clostridiales Family XIII bacterium]
MLLAFDVGNTNIVFGVYDGGKLIANWRMETDAGKSADEYGLTVNQLFGLSGVDKEKISSVIVSTVVPSTLFTIEHMSIKYFDIKPIIVEPGIKTGLTIKCNDPAQVGADRIVNAVSALSKYKGPLIIIDMGTATTFCVVTENWEYLGGVIAPGLKISSDALFEKTAKLPKIEIENPGKLICKSTIESMQAGVVVGHASMIDGIVKKLRNEFMSAPIKVIATGGLATMMKDISNSIDIV